MPQILCGSHHLRSLFAGLAEHTFQVRYGVADPPLIDYLAELLERFVRIDSIFKLRDIVGRRLEEVGEMLMEAEQRSLEGEANHECWSVPKREAHRQIGDFTLFWTGVYPEALKQLKRPDRMDAMVDYPEAGKRSYFIASTYSEGPYATEAPVLKRLSDQFELCADALREVRSEWETLA